MVDGTQVAARSFQYNTGYDWCGARNGWLDVNIDGTLVSMLGLGLGSGIGLGRNVVSLGVNSGLGAGAGRV